jgi:hypothetical protein
VPPQHGARLEQSADVEAAQTASSQLRVGALVGGTALDMERLGGVAGHERTPQRRRRGVGGLGLQRVALSPCVDIVFFVPDTQWDGPSRSTSRGAAHAALVTGG